MHPREVPVAGRLQSQSRGDSTWPNRRASDETTATRTPPSEQPDDRPKRERRDHDTMGSSCSWFPSGCVRRLGGRDDLGCVHRSTPDLTRAGGQAGLRYSTSFRSLGHQGSWNRRRGSSGWRRRRVGPGWTRTIPTVTDPCEGSPAVVDGTVRSCRRSCRAGEGLCRAVSPHKGQEKESHKDKLTPSLRGNTSGRDAAYPGQQEQQSDNRDRRLAAISQRKVSIRNSAATFGRGAASLAHGRGSRSSLSTFRPKLLSATATNDRRQLTARIVVIPKSIPSA